MTDAADLNRIAKEEDDHVRARTRAAINARIDRETAESSTGMGQ